MDYIAVVIFSQSLNTHHDYSPTVPTGPPVLTLYYTIDSTSLYLSWTAPPLDQQNGLIRRYDLILTELDTGAVFSFSTARTNFTATQLHPDYSYQIEVSAFTIGSGPRSPPLVLQTDEDGEYA